MLYCSQCGTPLAQGAPQCPGCGATILAGPANVEVGSPFGPPRGLGDDPGIRMLLPVGRSIWAIAAGYAGLFAVLGCAAPIALVLGIIAIRDIKAHPEKHGMGRAIFGLVMGIVFTIPLIVMLVVFVVQGMTHGRL